MVREKTNPNTNRLIKDLKLASYEHKAPIWKDLALRLSRSRKAGAEVNVSKLQRFGKDGDTIVVPGKVLGTGEIKKALNVAAFSMSKTARSKIENAGGNAMNIEELISTNPKGSYVRIME